MNSLKTIATICTSGGVLEQGAIVQSIAPIWGIEIDPEVAQLYKLNYPESQIIIEDVIRVNWHSLDTPLILHASPPCRNYSSANTKCENCSDIKIGSAIKDAIAYLRPQVFTLENVRQYANSESWWLIRSQLEKCGYSVTSQLVKLNLWGIPQTRVRFIVTAFRDISAPLLLTPNRTKYWYEEIKDLIPSFDRSNLTDTQKNKLSDRAKSAIAHGIPVLLKRNQIRDTTPCAIATNPNCWTVTAKLCTDGKGSDRALFADLVTREGVFSLNTRALARLQTIPDSYKFTGSVRIDGGAIGDGVPPYFAEQMYRQILDYLKRESSTRNGMIREVKPPRDVALGEAEHPGGVKPVLEASNMNIISKTPEYRAFNGAKSRCNNSANPSYKNYGGRGIKFKFSSFEEFIDHIGFRPSDNHSIDRIDNNGHYEIGNVRWATDIEQARNKRVCVPVSLIDVESNKVIKEFSTISEAADFTDYSFESIYSDCNKSNLDIDQKLVWSYSQNVEETLLFYKDIDAYRVLKKSKLIGGSKKSTIVEENLSEEEVDVLIKYVHSRTLKLNKYFNVGSALLEIKRLKLYRVKGYKSFEKFCLEEFEYKKTRLYQIINVAKVLNSLPSDIDPFLLDLTESHCRELKKIKDVEMRSLVLKQAANKGTITAKTIASTFNTLNAIEAQKNNSLPLPEINSVVRIVLPKNCELEKFRNYWGIVRSHSNYTCTVDTAVGVTPNILPQYLMILESFEGQEQLLTRLSRILALQEFPEIKPFAYAIATSPNPTPSYNCLKFLDMIERSQWLV